MVHEGEAQEPCKVETAPPVAPAQARDGGRHQHAEHEREREEPAVLPGHDPVLLQVARVGRPGFDARLHEHPANVRPPEPVVGAVRVEVGVCVPVMSAVVAGPPENGALYCACARDGAK